jgi:lipopolysaccharide transport system ATP-binding protein
LLIIDGVLAVGDVEFQKKCIGKMEDVASEGRTVLFVSHDLMAISNLCTRAILLKNGGVIADANTTNVISKYRNIDSAKDKNALFVLNDSLKKVKSGYFCTTSLKISGDHSGDTICLSEDLFFEIEYVKNIEVPLTADIAIVLKNQNLIPVVTFNTAFQKNSIKIMSSKGKFTCIVKDLLLVPGKYYIHLWISLNGEVAEIIENAGSFEIIESDIFKSGVIPNQRNHGFLIHTNYSFKVD